MNQGITEIVGAVVAESGFVEEELPVVAIAVAVVGNSKAECVPTARAGIDLFVEKNGYIRSGLIAGKAEVNIQSVV